jgi:hypothetical protein
MLYKRIITGDENKQNNDSAICLAWVLREASSYMQLKKNALKNI